MSVAEKFISIGAFPIYVGVPRYGDFWQGYPYVGDLTLAQVMALFWNLEHLTFTASCWARFTDANNNIETIDLNGSISLAPASSSGGFSNFTNFFGNDSGLHRVFTPTAGSSSARKPRDRVCVGNILTDYAAIAVDVLANAGQVASLTLQLGVLKDPINTGKYRVHHYFSLYVRSNQANPPASLGSVGWGGFAWSPYNSSGTMTIAGITFPWRFHATTIMPGVTISTTGGTISATSSNFTY